MLLHSQKDAPVLKFEGSWLAFMIEDVIGSLHHSSLDIGSETQQGQHRFLGLCLLVSFLKTPILNIKSSGPLTSSISKLLILSKYTFKSYPVAHTNKYPSSH